MPAPAEPARSTAEQYRQDVALLAEQAEGEITETAAMLDPDTVDETLRLVVPPLLDEYGAAAALVAAMFYDQMRDAARISGAFVAIPARIADPGAGADSLVRWARASATTEDTFATLVAGGVSRRVSNTARDTITKATDADPRARGWMRIGRGTACAFCRLLVSRGAVYRGATSRFAAHDHCRCQAAPIWDASQVVAVRREFVASAKSRQAIQATRAARLAP